MLGRPCKSLPQGSHQELEGRRPLRCSFCKTLPHSPPHHSPPSAHQPHNASLLGRTYNHSLGAKDMKERGQASSQGLESPGCLQVDGVTMPT